jgi:hypothetical protein
MPVVQRPLGLLQLLHLLLHLVARKSGPRTGQACALPHPVLGQRNGVALVAVPARVVTVTSPAVSPAGTRTMIRFCLRAMIRAGIPLNAALMARVML